VYSAVDYLRDFTGFGLARAENLIDCTQNCDVFVEVSGLLKAAAVDLAKIAADLRLLSSGPKGGFGEFRLPPRQAGSSIMPGKINPVITEAVTQAAYQVVANDSAITLAAQAGQLELNAFIPLIAHNLFQSLDLLTRAALMLKDKCILGIEVDEGHCRDLLERSAALATAMAPYIGYDEASRVAKTAMAENLTVPEVLLREGLITEEKLAEMLRPEQLTTPGIAGDRKRRET
jgi:aspartate ammonia-lyase